jgi:hypothetical protein
VLYLLTTAQKQTVESMVRPLLKVADRDEMSMADNFAMKNGKKKKRNDRTLVLVTKFSSIIADS